MKIRTFLCLVLLSVLNASLSTLFAQGTAFTYQGRLDESGAPASGIYDLRFTIYDSTNLPGTVVAGPVTVLDITISDGLFTATLDFGAGVFTGAARWLEIAVSTNDFASSTVLTPRQPITAAPYAIFAGGASGAGISGSLPGSGLAGTYSNAVTLNNGANSFSGTFIGQFYGSTFTGGIFTGAFLGDGSGLFGLNASALSSGLVPDARLAGNIARTNQVWLLNGNAGTMDGTHFVGTTDNEPVDFRVNNSRAFRLEPKAESPNIIGGSVSNAITMGQGSTIAGGGLPDFPNIISHDYAAIGGGTFHIVSGPWGTIAGGRDNRVHSESATVAGGFRNTILSNSLAATIAGGWNNVISSNALTSLIGGGFQNTISNGTDSAVIAGGANNRIGSNSDLSIIGAGDNNRISSNSFRAVLGGGFMNVISNNSGSTVLAGGFLNVIHSNSLYATIGGGRFNFANGEETTVAGGSGNSAAAFSAAIGGGGGNRAESAWSVIGGGQDNVIHAESTHITIAGGQANDIRDFSWGATISGGGFNYVDTNAYYSVIAGGYQNFLGRAALESVIGGGHSNEIRFNALAGVIGGGSRNAIEQQAHYSTLGGGQYNVIGTNSIAATLAGGFTNRIGSFAHDSTISGGGGNRIASGATESTIPGGLSNLVTGSFAFAAGKQAQALHTGSFVWSDSQPLPFASTSNNQFNVRANGGVRFETDGAGVSVDGLPVFSGSDGSGLGNVNAETLDGLSSEQFWQLGGNNVSAGQFIGSLNNQPIEIKVNTLRALRLERDGGNAVNIFGGSRSNGVYGIASSILFAATIGGGGSDGQPNIVSEDFATVAGGVGNIAGNTNASFDKPSCTVSGGNANQASGSYATVPGGRNNLAAGDFSFAFGRQAKANHQGSLVWADSNAIDLVSTNDNSVTMRASGGYRLFSNSTTNAGVFLAAGGGSWTSISDRHMKENFEPVDAPALLEKVARLPIQSWNYRSQDKSIRHIGPMAQDFKAAFQVGESETGITTVDADGVALAAIQGLNQKLVNELKRVDAENAELRRELSEIKALLRGKIAGNAN